MPDTCQGAAMYECANPARPQDCPVGTATALHFARHETGECSLSARARPGLAATAAPFVSAREEAC